MSMYKRPEEEPSVDEKVKESDISAETSKLFGASQREEQILGSAMGEV